MYRGLRFGLVLHPQYAPEVYLPDPRTATARIIEVACNAHARRKFYEARGSDALRSHQALAYYIGSFMNWSGRPSPSSTVRTCF